MSFYLLNIIENKIFLLENDRCENVRHVFDKNYAMFKLLKTISLTFLFTILILNLEVLKHGKQ